MTLRSQLQIRAREVETDHVTDATVTVSVVDMNDNNPQFSAESYSGRIKEDSVRGDAVTMTTAVAASDADSGSFANVTYSITGGSDV